MNETDITLLHTDMMVKVRNLKNLSGSYRQGKQIAFP